MTVRTDRVTIQNESGDETVLEREGDSVVATFKDGQWARWFEDDFLAAVAALFPCECVEEEDCCEPAEAPASAPGAWVSPFINDSASPYTNVWRSPDSTQWSWTVRV